MLDILYIALTAGFFRRGCGIRAPARAAVRRAMTFDLIVGAAVAALLLVYLAYALVRPERF